MPASKPVTVRVLSQPFSGASMMLKTRATSPVVAISPPPTSSLGASGSADSGTKARAPANATAATTTLMAKTAFQVQCSRTAPEATRPRRALPPATPAQTLTAWVRRSAGNVEVIVDKVAGMTNDAPSPNKPRSRISSAAEVAVMATAEPAPKMTRPTTRVRRRPNLSPMAPDSNRSEANISE